MESAPKPESARRAPVIPTRTSSKRDLRSASTGELSCTKLTFDSRIEKQKTSLKAMSSCDSEYWSKTAELYSLQIERNDCEAMLAFHTEASWNNSLSFGEFESSNTTGIDFFTQRAALEAMKSIATSQAASLESEGDVTQSYLKSFFGAPSGFDIRAASAGHRDNTRQSAMREEMVNKYSEGDRHRIWEPIIGKVLPPDLVNAAHLYPWRSAEHMDVIYGKGSVEEIMTACNGLFLHKSIEIMLDRGYIAIVPDIDMEPLDQDNPRVDIDRRRELVKNWEASTPREFKVVILDRCKAFSDTMRGILDFPNVYGIGSIEELDGRRLKFRGSFRPRARYVWWTYLNAIAQVTFRYKNRADIGFPGEVKKANRYWGTARSYVKRNMLSGFVKHIGQDLEGVRSALLGPDSITDDAETSDPTAASVLAKEMIRKTSVSLQKSGAVDEESESEDQSEDDSEDGSDDGSDDGSIWY